MPYILINICEIPFYFILITYIKSSSSINRDPPTTFLDVQASSSINIDPPTTPLFHICTFDRIAEAENP